MKLIYPTRYRVLHSFGQAVRMATTTGAELAQSLWLTGLPSRPYLLEVQSADGSSRSVERIEIR